MAKRPRKTKATKPAFAPPPPAVSKDSEFSFAEYAGEAEEATVTVEDDPFAVNGKDPFGGEDYIDWDEELGFLKGKHHRISHARREGVEWALLEDPFSTVNYEDLREDDEIFGSREDSEPPLTPLTRFQRVAKSLIGFAKVGDRHRDRERDEIQLRIALYWLAQAQKEGAFK